MLGDSFACALPNMLFMIFAPEQSYQLDYATCDYKEGVTGFSAKLLLSVRSWREKLRRCLICILHACMLLGWLMHSIYEGEKEVRR